ncbi:MAG: HU family DNA-binding protein [Verrucomicrobia bacterium]|nr:HU family DNA-binding protein [Verrucomicrobiota bacterium]
MPKMTKSQIAATVAEKVEIKKKQAALAIETLAALACKEAKKNGVFMVPGLGKLVLVNRPARKMIMRFGPKAGQEIDVPAKKVVKFRIAKAAKVAILGK